MLYIKYCSDGEAVNEFKLYEYVRGVLDKELANKNKGIDTRISTSTSLVIDAIRIAVLLGEIDRSRVVFKYNGENIHIDEYGNPSEWPRGFCDVDMNILEGILSTQCKKRKGEKIGNVSLKRILSIDA